jgi:hypothetical protein
MQLDLLALLEPTPDEILQDLLAPGELRGPANRERTVAAWRAAHGAYIVPSRRQHPWWLWELCTTAPGGHLTVDELAAWPTDNPGAHEPTILYVDRRNAHDEAPVDVDEEHLWYRAACLGCDFEGDPTTSENKATEDAHDHTHPWWRDLPLTKRLRYDASPKARAAAVAKALAAAEQAVPGCTASGRPIPVRTVREPGGTRHHSSGLLGGYDLCGAVEAA